MAKKKRSKPAEAEQIKEQRAPKFEIGTKGDDFDIAYTRAAREATADTDKLLYDLSRESRADKFNLTDALLPFILIVFAAVTFIALSRGDTEELLSEKPTLQSLLDGSYTKMLTDAYSDTLPYGEELGYIASLFGFGDTEKPFEEAPPVDEPAEPNEPIVTEPAVTEPTATTTEPTTATPETTTEATTAAKQMAYANAVVNVRDLPSSDGNRLGHLEVGEEVEVLDSSGDWYKIIYNGEEAYAYGEYLTLIEQVTTPPADTSDAESSETEPTEFVETLEMYASGTVTIRLSPDNGGVNVGYFVENDPVSVIEIRDDGWAEILFGGMRAYVHSDYLLSEPIVTAAETQEEEETVEEETSAEEIIEETSLTEEEIIPDESETEVTSAPEEETTETTTSIDWEALFPGMGINR